MILMKDIVKEGHPVLKQVAKDVELPLTNEDSTTLSSMREFLKNSQDPELSEKYGLRAGVGLAAPQINVSKRMFVIRLNGEEDKEYDQAFINPKIVSHSVEKAYLSTGEGCLSVDRTVPGYVPRYARITIKAFDETGKEFKMRLKGLPAIVCQHELDHLNGIMFYDHINQEDPFHIPENSTPLER